MRKKWIIVVSVIGAILLGTVLAGPVMSVVEKPKYKIITAEKNIEVRLYSPMIIAATEITDNRKEAISKGFRLLADYIFGNNIVQKNIAMTAPVQQQSSQKIPMTAPVQQQSTGHSWTISFVMPSKYTMESLPKPNDKRVTLKEIPSQKFVVIRFSGLNSDANIKKHEKRLKYYINTHKLAVTGSPKYAFYNPPWTLPFMRRNEVMIEIKQ